MEIVAQVLERHDHRMHRQARRYVIIEAPSILGLKPTGVEKLPECLLAHGLADRLQAHPGTRVVMRSILWAGRVTATGTP